MSIDNILDFVNSNLTWACKFLPLGTTLGVAKVKYETYSHANKKEEFALAGLITMGVDFLSPDIGFYNYLGSIAGLCCGISLGDQVYERVDTQLAIRRIKRGE